VENKASIGLRQGKTGTAPTHQKVRRGVRGTFLPSGTKKDGAEETAVGKKEREKPTGDKFTAVSRLAHQPGYFRGKKRAGKVIKR